MRYCTYSAGFTHSGVSRNPWSQCFGHVGYCTYPSHMCNTGHFGQVPFRSVEARCTTRACRTGFPRAGGPVRLRATRLSLGSRTTTRGSLRSPSVTSSNVEWTGRSLPLPLFLRFSRGRHKQVGKLRRIPGGVTFLSGLTGRPSRNRERSVKPRRDLWSVAVG